MSFEVGPKIPKFLTSAIFMPKLFDLQLQNLVR